MCGYTAAPKTDVLVVLHVEWFNYLFDVVL